MKVDFIIVGQGIAGTCFAFELLKYNNIPSGKFQTNIDLGFEANKKFKNEIDKYSFNWRTGGQFSKNINSTTS